MRGLTPEQQKRIVDKYIREKGMFMRKIAKIEKVSRSAVYNAIKKYGEDFSFTGKPKSGRRTGSHNCNVNYKNELQSRLQMLNIVFESYTTRFNQK